MAQELFSLLWPRCLEKYNSFLFPFLSLEARLNLESCPDSTSDRSRVLRPSTSVSSSAYSISWGFSLLAHSLRFQFASLDSVLIVFSSVASLSFEKGTFVEYHWDSWRLRLLHCCMRFWVLSDCLQLFLLVCSLEFV